TSETSRQAPSGPCHGTRRRTGRPADSSGPAASFPGGQAHTGDHFSGGTCERDHDRSFLGSLPLRRSLLMPSFFRRQWLKRCARALRHGGTFSQAGRRRQTRKPVLEQLEHRCVPAAVPPGVFSQNFTANTEFNVTNGVYEIAASVAVNPGVTLQVDP